MNFKLNIFDEIGLLYERENQENNQKYEPVPINFMNPNFPVDYEGINMKFFVNEISLFEKFKKIEIQLTSIK